MIEKKRRGGRVRFAVSVSHFGAALRRPSVDDGLFIADYKCLREMPSRNAYGRNAFKGEVCCACAQLCEVQLSPTGTLSSRARAELLWTRPVPFGNLILAPCNDSSRFVLPSLSLSQPDASRWHCGQLPLSTSLTAEYGHFLYARRRGVRELKKMLQAACFVRR